MMNNIRLKSLYKNTILSKEKYFRFNPVFQYMYNVFQEKIIPSSSYRLIID